MAMIRFQCYLPAQQLTVLRKLEAEIGVPVAASIRFALDQYLAQRRATTKRKTRRVGKGTR